jgi:hypothetical protein
MQIHLGDRKHEKAELPVPKIGGNNVNDVSMRQSASDARFFDDLLGPLISIATVKNESLPRVADLVGVALPHNLVDGREPTLAEQLNALERIVMCIICRVKCIGHHVEH